MDLSSPPETYKVHCHNYIHVTFNQRGLDVTRVNLGDSKELVKLTQPVRNTTVLPVSSRKLLSMQDTQEAARIKSESFIHSEVTRR